MKYRRPILVILSATLAICLIIIVTAVICWKVIVLNFAENEFRAVFKGSSVMIGSRNVTPGTLVFRDINIKTGGRPFLKIKEFRIDFTILSILKDRAAEFSIKEAVVYAKFTIVEIHGLAMYAKDTLSLSNVFARTLNGIIEGGAMTKRGKTPSYSASLKLKDIQLEKVVEVFELSEKINITGSADGSLELSGEGSVMTSLKGKFEAYPDGGILTIKSKEWLDAIALYAKQDTAIIEENFKNYRYDEGNASLGLVGNNIIIDAHLSGAAGKRDLAVSLHEFN